MAISSVLQFPEAAKNLGLEPEDFSNPLLANTMKTALSLEYRGDNGEVPMADLEVILKVHNLSVQLGYVRIGSYDQAAKWVKALQEYSVASVLDFQIHDLWSREYGDNPGSDRVEALRNILSSAQLETAGTEIASLEAITRGFLSETGEAINQGKISFLSTGLALTDRFLKGLRPGDLTYVASDAGSGKTSLVQYIVRRVAKQRRVALVSSAEMSEAQLGEREAAALIGKEMSEQWTNSTDVERAVRLMDGCEYLKNIKIDSSPSISLSALEGKIRRLVQTTGLDLLVIDHIEYVGFSIELNDNERLRRAIMGLKALGKIYGIPVIVIGHISREAERMMYEGKRPNKSWLRGSTHLSGVPDNIVIPVRDQASGSCQVDCHVIKSRMGLTGVTSLLYNTEYGSYSEV